MLRPLPLTYLNLELGWLPIGMNENEDDDEEDAEEEDGDTVGYDLEINFEQPYEPGNDVNLNPENDVINPIGSFVRGLITKPNILIERITRAVPTLRTIVLRIHSGILHNNFVYDVTIIDEKAYIRPSTKDLDTIILEERMEGCL